MVHVKGGEPWESVIARELEANAPFYKEESMAVREAYQVNPPYSIWLTIWKGLRPGLWAAGAAALLVLAGYFADASNLVAVGLPPLAAMMLAEVIRNAVKEYRRRK